MTNQLLTRKKLCDIHGIGETTFRRWSKQESFPTAVKTEGTISFWDRKEFAEWMNANCEQSATYSRWRLKTERPAEVG